MGGSAQWTPQVASLGQDRPVICVDLPGFGAHAHLPPINRIEGFADWVIAHLRSLGVTRYDLIGHSMGGMIVQEMALRDAAAIDRLVLYGTGPLGVLPGRFETIETSKRRAAQDGAAATARRIAATWFLAREHAARYSQTADIAERASLAAIHAGLDAMQAWSGAQALGQITAQTLIVWGDGDRTYAWDQVHRLWTGIAGARLAVVPNCAHAVHCEKPDLFNALIADFLAAPPLSGPDDAERRTA